MSGTSFRSAGWSVPLQFSVWVVLRACLHGGGGPQVGEVTRLAVVEKWPAFTCKLTTPGSRGDFTWRCCVVVRHVNIENGGRTVHFGGQCYFIFIFCSRCSISMLWRFTVTFDDTKPPPEAVNGHIILVQIFTRFGALANVKWTRPRLGGLPHLESFTWQNATPARRVTLPGRPGNPPRRVTPPIM